MVHPGYNLKHAVTIELIGGPRDGDQLLYFDEPETFLDRRWCGGRQWKEHWWRRRDVCGLPAYAVRDTEIVLLMDFVRTIIVER